MGLPRLHLWLMIVVKCRTWKRVCGPLVFKQCLLLKISLLNILRHKNWGFRIVPPNNTVNESKFIKYVDKNLINFPFSSILIARWNGPFPTLPLSLCVDVFYGRSLATWSNEVRSTLILQMKAIGLRVLMWTVLYLRALTNWIAAVLSDVKKSFK